MCWVRVGEVLARQGRALGGGGAIEGVVGEVVGFVGGVVREKIFKARGCLLRVFVCRAKRGLAAVCEMLRRACVTFVRIPALVRHVLRLSRAGGGRWRDKKGKFEEKCVGISGTRCYDGQTLGKAHES